MKQHEYKLLVAGLGKLAGELFENHSYELRKPIEDAQKTILKMHVDDDNVLNYTVRVACGGTDSNGHDVGKQITAILKTLNIPNHEDSEICEAFVYFNNRHFELVRTVLDRVGLFKDVNYNSAEPFYHEISNWPNAEKYWDDRVDLL